jgi:hypothetical protein
MRKPEIMVNQNVAAARPFWVYIMASERNGTLYIGIWPRAPFSIARA